MSLDTEPILNTGFKILSGHAAPLFGSSEVPFQWLRSLILMFRLDLENVIALIKTY